MTDSFEKTDPRPVTFEMAKKSFEAIKKKFDARRPKLDEFSVENGGPYSAAEVARDKAWLMAKKKQIFVSGTRGANPEMEEKRLYAEYVFMEMVDCGELFENDPIAVMPGSEYDDLNNGADAVITIADMDDGEDLVFSVDIKAALTSASENVEQVVFKVDEKIISGTGSEVKYYEHRDEESKETVRHGVETPNLIIWLEPEEIKKLMIALSKKLKERSTSDNQCLERLKAQLYKEMKERCGHVVALLERQRSNNSTRIERLTHLQSQYQQLLDKLNEY